MADFSVGTLCPLHHLRYETSTFCIRSAIVGEFTLADAECDCLLVLTCAVAVRTGVARIGHRATQDVRGSREGQALRRGAAIPTSQGLRTSGPVFLSGVMSGVTMLVISRDLEHQDLSYVYSGSVGFFRSACYGRPASHRRGTCQLCARSKRRSGSLSATLMEAESLRCETVQVERRRPYLMTRAAVLGRCLHAHKS